MVKGQGHSVSAWQRGQKIR